VRTVFFLVIASLLLFYSKNAHAHNLWIVGDANNNGDGAIHLYFEHHVGPGDGAYLGPIEERGKTWLTTPDKKSVLVDMKAVHTKDTKYLAGNSGNISGSYAIDHTSLYGIYHGRLDFFHGRHIEAYGAEDLNELAETPHLPVRIVPNWTEKGLLLKVMYFNTPKPRTSVWVLKSDGTEREMTTNNKGELLIGPIIPEKYHYCTRIIENDPAGAFEYQAFKGIMHGTSLTIKFHESFFK
jgi:hypothetical protein